MLNAYFRRCLTYIKGWEVLPSVRASLNPVLQLLRLLNEYTQYYLTAIHSAEFISYT